MITFIVEFEKINFMYVIVIELQSINMIQGGKISKST